MNLNKEIKTIPLLIGLTACMVLGIILAYFLVPHLLPKQVIEDTITIGGNKVHNENPNNVNSPPPNLILPSRGTSIKPTTVTPTGTDKPNQIFCAQIITKGKNPATGEIREFPTPCDVPEGWETLPSGLQ